MALSPLGPMWIMYTLTRPSQLPALLARFSGHIPVFLAKFKRLKIK